VNRVVDLNEGNTNAYVVHASLACFLCIPLVISFPVFGTPFLILALSVFATTNGFEIDLEARKYRKYGRYYSFKFGSWQPFSDPERAELVLSTERSTFQGGNASTPTVTVKTRTFDIVLHLNSEKENTVYEFLNYQQAKEALAAFESLGIPVRNRIQEKIAERRSR